MDRVWDIIGHFFGRAALGGLSGFAVMLVVGWTAIYFELAPAEPQATRYATYLFLGVAIPVAFLGLRAAKVAVMTVPVFMICMAFVLMWQELNAIAGSPDLNNDGAFTVRDFLHASARVLSAPGEWYSQTVFGPITPETGFVIFLEISAGLLAWVARLGLTAFYWFMAIGWIPLIIRYQPPED